MKLKYVLLKYIILAGFLGLTKPTWGADTLVLKLNWTTQAQFLGFYVAQEKGYYQEQDLVVIIPSTPSQESKINTKYPLVRSIYLWEALNQERQGKTLINIAQLSQKSSLLFIAKKTKGYRSIQDFKGSRVGIWKSPEGEVFKSVLSKANIPVETILFQQGVNLLMYDAVDVICATSYNERFALEIAGYDTSRLDYFYLSDYAYNLPEEGLYVDADQYIHQTELFRRFVKASHKGWQDSFENTYEALKILTKRMQQNFIPFSFVAQRRMLINIYKQYINDQSNQVDFYLEFDPFMRTAAFVGIKPELARTYYQRMNQTP